MNKKTIRIALFLLVLLAFFTLASCDKALSQGIHKHEWGAWETTKAASCNENGVHTRACKSCDETETKETQPIGHDMVAFEDSVADCTNNGYKNYKECSRCGHSEGEKTNALGHRFAAWYGNTATCTKAGKEYADCRVCDFVKERETDAKGHNIIDSFCVNCYLSDILVLVEDGKAKFTVVSTASSGYWGKLAADEFVNTLRGLGIEVADAAVDIETDKMTDYEIIIGANAVGRGEDCNITDKYLGPVGEVIKRVGNKIIFAASTPQVTVDLFEGFVSEELGISDSTTELDYLETSGFYNYENIKYFPIDNITINSKSLLDYDIVVDILPYMSGFSTSGIDSFQEDLYEAWGYRLTQITADEMVSGEKYFIIRYTEDAGDEGFRAYIDGNNFVVECAYANKFDDTFVEFANKYILSKTGNVSFETGFAYEKTVNKVYYEDFGAVGDGETCDFEHIYNAHVFANQCGQKVYGKAGATYYIDPKNFTRRIPIKTDVDFLGATFIIDDVGDAAYASRQTPLFSIARSVDYRSISSSVIAELYGSAEVSVPRGTSSLEWLAPELNGKSFVQLQSLHRDYIRHGANQNSGEQRSEVLIVDADGKLADDTHVVFDYDRVYYIRISTADDEPITVENGNFYNICCKTIKSTYYDKYVTAEDGQATKVRMYYANRYDAYKRGFAISRSNVTLKKITHEMLDEPELGDYSEESGYDPSSDSLYEKFGSRHESYPYYGFIFVDRSYNLNVIDTQLDGHTTYYENKSQTVSTGGETPDPVPMGSYDFVLENSINVTFKNVVQKAETGLGDSRYWGIMSSNGSRNLTFENCEINRFDAHRGFWNATLKNTTIGHSFNVIGGGTLIADGVTKLTGSGSQFISLRSDYGATFRGDIILKNCTFENHPAYNTSTGGSYKSTRNNYAYIISSGFSVKNDGWNPDATVNGAYWLWDFGYTCYMPESITFENFTSYANRGTYVFNDLPDLIFEESYTGDKDIVMSTVKYPYQITKSITYIGGMTPFEICRGVTKAPSGIDTPYTYNKLKSIPIHKHEDIDGACDTCEMP